MNFKFLKTVSVLLICAFVLQLTPLGVFAQSTEQNNSAPNNEFIQIEQLSNHFGFDEFDVNNTYLFLKLVDGTTVNYVYDELDRLTSKKVNGTTQFTQVYNNSGAIGKYKDNVTGVTWTYNYDAIGRLKDIFGSNGNKYKIAYNSKNLINLKKYEVSGKARKVDYTYTAQGVPKTATYQDNKLTRTLDSLGRVSTLVTKTSADVNLTTSYSYYNYGTNNTTTRISSVTNPIGTYNYTYDALGNVTGVSGAISKTFTYDSLGQLTNEISGEKEFPVTYDTNGNVLTRGDNVFTYENPDWPDQLTSYNGRTYTYDELGNATSWRRGMIFTWQKGRQLSSIELDGDTYTYTYDSSGVRTSKTVDGVTTNFTYVDGKLIHQTDGTNIWWFYYDSDGTLLAMEYNESLYFYQFDGLGNIVGLVDVNGNVVAEYTYTIWGLASTTGTIASKNPLRFKGYYFDTETQLYYLMSRYYDPVVCRFINADSFASTGQGVLGYNMYAYCNNNPIMLKDSEGTRPMLSAYSVCAETEKERDASFDYMRALMKEKYGSPATSKPLSPPNIPEGGTVVHKGPIRICTDGSDGTRVPDDYWQQYTAFSIWTNKYVLVLDAYVMPYVVMPKGSDANKGDLAILINWDTGQYVNCIVGEVGPAANGWGEVSIAAIWKTGYSNHSTANTTEGITSNYEIVLYSGTSYGYDWSWGYRKVLR